MANPVTDGLSFNVRGLDQVKAALANFAGDMRKTVRQSLRVASKPLRIAAQANAPVLKYPVRRRVAGTLRKNIKIVNSKRANGRDGVLGVYLTVKASRKDLKKAPITGDPYYWRWVESGHKIVTRSRRIGTRNGKARYEKTLRARRESSQRNVAGSLFLLRAFRSHGQTTINNFSEQVLRRVEKFNRTK
jgi:hypothetical protein